MSTTEQETDSGGGPAHALKRMVLPAAASAASAITAYLVKKAIPLVREKIEELNENGTLGQAKEAVTSPLSSVTDRFGGDGSDDGEDTSSSRSGSDRSSTEMEQQREARAKARNERKKALKAAS